MEHSIIISRKDIEKFGLKFGNTASAAFLRVVGSIRELLTHNDEVLVETTSDKGNVTVNLSVEFGNGYVKRGSHTFRVAPKIDLFV